MSKREISGRNRRTTVVLLKQEPYIQNGRVGTYVVATSKSEVWEQNWVWLFYYSNFERNYDVLKNRVIVLYYISMFKVKKSIHFVERK